ncbi:hypothetical protein MKW98_030123 [Papaver atlanticum]|uniref:Serine carboxypeptidase-like 18 n=1 Tax=Papaver atlanticum TaxID=357466 RepID=A0AAD4XRW2_9MAGN|nr:hypothetical protein MKW98_030123 [Papaver atlanticum]
MGKDLTKHSTIQLFIICLVFHLLLLLPLNQSELEAAVSSGKLVTHLPWLAVQPLPFHLETGYIGIGGRQSSRYDDDNDSSDNELFYYFIKSERNPKEDPLVLWLTGGPRCSSFSGLAFEIGPVYMTQVEYSHVSSPTLTLNPNSWTKIANIIFLDQPVNTGFSYTKSSNDPEMSDTISWLIQNPEFQSNPIYIAGDSYAGIIVPIVFQHLIRDIEDGTHPFLNLKSYSLGNPVTHMEMEKNARVEYAYGMGFVSYELYQSMRANCNGNFLNFDLSNANCSRNRQVYEDLISGINLSQILEPLCIEGSTVTAYPNPAEMIQHSERIYCRNQRTLMSQYWANDVAVRKALHVREGTIGKWNRCNRCNRGLPYEKDVKSAIEYHRNISTKGYKVLIYSGDHDMRVVRISTESWIRSLDNLSILDEWRPWFVSGLIAGFTRAYSNGLTYATVKGGGHEAPGYKPEECYAMFERWISNTPL